MVPARVALVHNYPHQRVKRTRQLGSEADGASVAVHGFLYAALVLQQDAPVTDQSKVITTGSAPIQPCPFLRQGKLTQRQRNKEPRYLMCFYRGLLNNRPASDELEAHRKITED